MFTNVGSDFGPHGDFVDDRSADSLFLVLGVQLVPSRSFVSMPKVFVYREQTGNRDEHVGGQCSLFLRGVTFLEPWIQ